MPQRFPFAAPLVLALAAALPAAPAVAFQHAADDALSTHAERTGYRQTGRYDEVIALCAKYQAQWPDAVRCFDFGTTPQGRPMKAMAVSTSGHLDPASARA